MELAIYDVRHYSNSHIDILISTTVPVAIADRCFSWLPSLTGFHLSLVWPSGEDFSVAKIIVSASNPVNLFLNCVHEFPKEAMHMGML